MSITIKDLPDDLIDNIKYRVEHGFPHMSLNDERYIKELRESFNKNEKIKKEYKELLRKLEA